VIDTLASPSRAGGAPFFSWRDQRIQPHDMQLLADRDFRNSFYDGIFANMFAVLTGGVFLTGFALFLGMNEITIGLLASIPLLVTVFQLPTSCFIGKHGRRRGIAHSASAVARVIWIPIFIAAIVPGAPAAVKRGIRGLNRISERIPRSLLRG
jgi:hypothetical protein